MDVGYSGMNRGSYEHAACQSWAEARFHGCHSENSDSIRVVTAEHLLINAFSWIEAILLIRKAVPRLSQDRAQAGIRQAFRANPRAEAEPSFPPRYTPSAYR
jgi:hypothetical protein